MTDTEKIKELSERYAYDPETGILSTKKRLYRYPLGTIIDGISNGHVRASFHRKRIPVHRIIWALMYGRFPIKHIDHINGVKSDNRLVNLRECTNWENQQNKRVHREGALPGVRPVSGSTTRWRAYRTFQGKYEHLGCFGSSEEAHKEYIKVWNSSFREAVK